MPLPIRAKKGGKEYKMFLEGKRLTLRQSVSAQCYHCCGAYDDGMTDCKNGKSCPLYQHHPYNPNRVKLRKGNVASLHK